MGGPISSAGAEDASSAGAELGGATGAGFALGDDGSSSPPQTPAATARSGADAPEAAGAAAFVSGGTTTASETAGGATGARVLTGRGIVGLGTTESVAFPGATVGAVETRETSGVTPEFAAGETLAAGEAAGGEMEPDPVLRRALILEARDAAEGAAEGATEAVGVGRGTAGSTLGAGATTGGIAETTGVGADGDG